MRSFHQVIVFLFALLVCAFAQSTGGAYEATVYITSTVTRVNTVTASGASPTGSIVNHTSTIRYTPPASYAVAHNSTMAGSTGSPALIGSASPSGTATKPSTPEFTGAASALNVNALVAALAAAGAGYLVL